MSKKELIEKLKCSFYRKDENSAPWSTPAYTEGWVDGWNDAVKELNRILSVASEDS